MGALYVCKIFAFSLSCKNMSEQHYVLTMTWKKDIPVVMYICRSQNWLTVWTFSYIFFMCNTVFVVSVGFLFVLIKTKVIHSRESVLCLWFSHTLLLLFQTLIFLYSHHPIVFLSQTFSFFSTHCPAESTSPHSTLGFSFLYKSAFMWETDANQSDRMRALIKGDPVLCHLVLSTSNQETLARRKSQTGPVIDWQFQEKDLVYTMRSKSFDWDWG